MTKRKGVVLAEDFLNGAMVFDYYVNDTEHYGVVGFKNSENINSIVEKPVQPASSYAVTGFYFVDCLAFERAKKLKPSAWGELEVTSLLESYLSEDNLTLEKMGRSFAWFERRMHSLLFNAGNFVRTITERQGLQFKSPDEVVFKLGWISKEYISHTAKQLKKNKYGDYLEQLFKVSD